jgi:thiol-disulfide isomerase/thioredoxin
MSQPIKEKTIISYFNSRQDFLNLLAKNPGLVILKLGATWCGPCKKIKSLCEEWFSKLPSNVIIVDIDIDETMELYMALKKYKMVNGIPSILSFYSKILKFFNHIIKGFFFKFSEFFF